MRKKSIATVAGLALLSPALAACAAQEEKLEPWQQAQKTEVWEPVPEVVETPVGKAPSDAVVLFDGTDLSAWESVKGGEAGPLAAIPSP